LRERRQEEILAKATAVFAEHGYPNTDVQFVADPLGISKGTVYRYFPSKESLFLAAVERGVRQLEEHMNRAIFAEPDLVERMAVATTAYLEFFAANPALVELFIQERAEFRDRKKPVYFERDCADECVWEQSLRDLIATGRVRDVPVERVMTVLGDLVYGTMFTNHFAGRKKPFAEQAADIVDVVFHGILTDVEKRHRASRNGNGRQKKS
jgi:AcrR family transcriptional regulator